MTETANKKEWYVVNTYAGHENRVKDNLEKDHGYLGKPFPYCRR